MLRETLPFSHKGQDRTPCFLNSWWNLNVARSSLSFQLGHQFVTEGLEVYQFNTEEIFTWLSSSSSMPF